MLSKELATKVRDLFVFFLVIILGALLLEFIFPGIIITYFDLNYLVLAAVITLLILIF